MKRLFVYFALPLLVLLSNSSGDSAPPSAGQSGTLEKMTVASGSVSMDLDLNRLNGTKVATEESKLDTLRFQVAPYSPFTVLVFNNALRGPDSGSIALTSGTAVSVPAALQTS